MREEEVFAEAPAAAASLDIDGNAGELCEVIRLASLCGLGQAAPLSVLSGLREFPRDFAGLTGCG